MRQIFTIDIAFGEEDYALYTVGEGRKLIIEEVIRANSDTNSASVGFIDELCTTTQPYRECILDLPI